MRFKLKSQGPAREQNFEHRGGFGRGTACLAAVLATFVLPAMSARISGVSALRPSAATSGRADGFRLTIGVEASGSGSTYNVRGARLTVGPAAWRGVAAPGTRCSPGDADRSRGFVDANDFRAVQAAFGADVSAGGPGDADCSGGFVDAVDFMCVQAHFGTFHH